MALTGTEGVFQMEVYGNRVAAENLPLPPPLAPPPPRRVKKIEPPREGSGDAWETEPPASEEPGLELGIAIPDVRRPRLGATANGKRIDHLLISGQVTNNSYYQADTFRFEVALQEEGEFAMPFWADNGKIEMEIFAGFGPSIQPNKSLILGRVDGVTLDLVQRTVSVNGRDYTADLIETKTTEKFPNMTASEIVEAVASRHGLTPIVTPTSVLAGKYYKDEHARLTDQTTEWTLLTYLAEQEGMEVYIQGRGLYFEPPKSAVSAAKWTVKYDPSRDNRPPRAGVERFEMREDKGLNRDISVKVISWNQKKKRAFEKTAQTRLMKTTGVGGLPRTPYVFRIPGLTEEQALREAEKRLREISRHLRQLELRLPGHPDITPRAILVVQGTGTTFDDSYRIDEITREMDMNNGFVMSMRARNIPPDSVASI